MTEPRIPTSIETAVIVHGRVRSNVGSAGRPQYIQHEDGYRWSLTDIRTPVPREPGRRDLDVT
jgi:hypothetical protein